MRSVLSPPRICVLSEMAFRRMYGVKEDGKMQKLKEENACVQRGMQQLTVDVCA